MSTRKQKRLPAIGEARPYPIKVRAGFISDLLHDGGFREGKKTWRVCGWKLDESIGYTRLELAIDSMDHEALWNENRRIQKQAQEAMR